MASHICSWQKWAGKVRDYTYGHHGQVFVALWNSLMYAESINLVVTAMQKLHDVTLETEMRKRKCGTECHLVQLACACITRLVCCGCYSTPEKLLKLQMVSCGRNLI